MPLDEPIEIVDYDPRWVGAFGGERDRVRIGLGLLHLRFEHIGGTAVPGMAGRPVVDLMLGAVPAVWAALPDVRARLVALGYEDLGETGVPGRIAFRRRTAQRSFTIALVELDGKHWRDNLALRDYLRGNAEEAAKYAEAKRAGKKEAVIGALLEKARSGG